MFRYFHKLILNTQGHSILLFKLLASQWMHTLTPSWLTNLARASCAEVSFLVKRRLHSGWITWIRPPSQRGNCGMNTPRMWQMYALLFLGHWLLLVSQNLDYNVLLFLVWKEASTQCRKACCSPQFFRQCRHLFHKANRILFGSR